MSADLRSALREEQSVFLRFNSFQKLSKYCTAYASPGSSEVPHWNLVYPCDLTYCYAQDELDAAESFYARQRADGHVLVSGDRWEKDSAETCEYFVAAGGPSPDAKASDVTEFSTSEGPDLGDFCAIVKASFELSDKTADYFRAKMDRLAASGPSRFWLIAHQGERCGTASVFKTADGSEFLFNFGVLPAFREKNLGSAMLRHVMSRSAGTIYTYSPNPVMRTKLLPAAGFQSLGVAHAVPIKRYRSES